MYIFIYNLLLISRLKKEFQNIKKIVDLIFYFLKTICVLLRKFNILLHVNLKLTIKKYILIFI